MRNLLTELKKKAQSNPKRIVFPESDDDRVIEAVSIIAKEKIAHPFLVGDADAIHEKAQKLGVNLQGAEIRDPNHDVNFEVYVKDFCELRKGKGMTEQKAREALKDFTYFGTMMVYKGHADGFVSGACHPTGDTLRPALQIVKTHDKFHKVSSFFMMMLEKKLLFFADCAVEINPDAKDLADIAIDTAKTAQKFGIDPRVAMLSFSTNGSARHPMVDKVKEATSIVNTREPSLVVEGEMQVDAAIVPKICSSKFPGSNLHGDANILIFPDLNSANMAYKLVERLAKAHAVGPILQGLKKPINDLSRGCSVEDIVDLTAITVVEAQEEK